MFHQIYLGVQPGRPAQVKTMCGKHCIGLLSEIFHPRHAASRVDRITVYIKIYGL